MSHVTHFIDYTYPLPQQNLAFDEALLDLCEEGFSGEILRFWEAQEYFVVLGYSNKVHLEVNQDSCRACSIPVLRRVSGGGAVLQGPGSLNYALILNVQENVHLQSIAGTHAYILSRHQQALEGVLGNAVERVGTSDLALEQMKFSGNAQRRKRRYLLFHGTFLYDFDLTLMSRFLNHPSREPAYRNGRSHENFLTNIGLSRDTIKNALKSIWGATRTFEPLPL